MKRNNDRNWPSSLPPICEPPAVHRSKLCFCFSWTPSPHHTYSASATHAASSEEGSSPHPFSLASLTATSMQPPWRPCPCRSFEWTWLRPRSWKSCVKLARSRKSCVASYGRSTFLAWQCPSPGNSSPDSPPSFSATTARRRTSEAPFNAGNREMPRCRTWSRSRIWRSRPETRLAD